MDPTLDLTPTDLFSPSKARQQRAQAQDWAHIDSWLAAKYAGRSIPTFERNDETLKALRALAGANERADEEQRLLERVEREALGELESVETSPDPNHPILTALKLSLPATGLTSLTALATISTLLSTPSPDPETLAHSLITHTTTLHTLSTSLSRLQTLHAALSAQLSTLRAELRVLNGDEFVPPANLPRQTAERTRVTKGLRGKLREAEGQLATLSQSQSQAQSRNGDGEIGTAGGLAAFEERERGLLELRGRVADLENRVQGFKGLPMEKEGARQEVRRVEGELEGLERRRDGLFEGLVGN